MKNTSLRITRDNIKKKPRLGKLNCIVLIMLLPVFLSFNKASIHKEVFNISNLRNNSQIQDSNIVTYYFKTYTNNTRFYKIEYPSFLKMGGDPTNNDGRTFTDDKGEVELTVFSSVLQENSLFENYKAVLLRNEG